MTRVVLPVALLLMAPPALSATHDLCIPFDKVADAEFLPGGWNIRLTDKSKATIWFPYNSQETQNVLVCHKAGKWYARKQQRQRTEP